jgi:hypothetical protein
MSEQAKSTIREGEGMKLIYQSVIPSSVDIERRISQAFDVLFESAISNYQLHEEQNGKEV